MTQKERQERSKKEIYQAASPVAARVGLPAVWLSLPEARQVRASK